MDGTFDRLENAIRHGHTKLAVALAREIRCACDVQAALAATCECALWELDGSTEQEALERFVDRIAEGLDCQSD